MKLNYKTKENETISLEINAEELGDLTSIIVEFGQIFKESELSLEDFFKELINPSTDVEKEPEEDFMNQPVKGLVECRSTRSKVYPERQAFTKQWLRNNGVDFDTDRNSVGDEVLNYNLTGDQVVELMRFLKDNECDTRCYI
jgi:hypothetical protein